MVFFLWIALVHSSFAVNQILYRNCLRTFQVLRNRLTSEDEFHSLAELPVKYFLLETHHRMKQELVAAYVPVQFPSLMLLVDSDAVDSLRSFNRFSLTRELANNTASQYDVIVTTMLNILNVLPGESLTSKTFTDTFLHPSLCGVSADEMIFISAMFHFEGLAVLFRRGSVENSFHRSTIWQPILTRFVANFEFLLDKLLGNNLIDQGDRRIFSMAFKDLSQAYLIRGIDVSESNHCVRLATQLKDSFSTCNFVKKSATSIALQVLGDAVFMTHKSRVLWTTLFLQQAIESFKQLLVTELKMFNSLVLVASVFDSLSEKDPQNKVEQISFEVLEYLRAIHGVRGIFDPLKFAYFVSDPLENSNHLKERFTEEQMDLIRYFNKLEGLLVILSRKTEILMHADWLAIADGFILNMIERLRSTQLSLTGSHYVLDVILLSRDCLRSTDMHCVISVSEKISRLSNWSLLVLGQPPRRDGDMSI